MTVEQHFELSQPPFLRTSTSATMMRTRTHDQIIERLRFAVARDTPALLVAESGCGKSTTLSLFAQSPTPPYLVSPPADDLAPFSFIAHPSPRWAARPAIWARGGCLVAHSVGSPRELWSRRGSSAPDVSSRTSGC